MYLYIYMILCTYKNLETIDNTKYVIFVEEWNNSISSF